MKLRGKMNGDGDKEEARMQLFHTTQGKTVRQWNTSKKGNNEKGIKMATQNSFLSNNFLL